MKFISCDGSYPCLCYGTLKIEVDGKVYEIENALESGGLVWFDEEWLEHIEEGKWELDDRCLPNELLPFIDEIRNLVNKNIPYGCCGGCV